MNNKDNYALIGSLNALREARTKNYHELKLLRERLGEDTSEVKEMLKLQNLFKEILARFSPWLELYRLFSRGAGKEC